MNENSATFSLHAEPLAHSVDCRFFRRSPKRIGRNRKQKIVLYVADQILVNQSPRQRKPVALPEKQYIGKFMASFQETMKFDVDDEHISETVDGIITQMTQVHMRLFIEDPSCRAENNNNKE